MSTFSNGLAPKKVRTVACIFSDIDMVSSRPNLPAIVGEIVLEPCDLAAISTGVLAMATSSFVGDSKNKLSPLLTHLFASS